MKATPKRLLSLLLLLVMAANLMASAIVPAVAADSGGVVLNKSVRLEADGTYSIDLSGYVTGQTVTSQVTSHTPLDVVLVLDASSSMLKFKNTPETYTQTDEIPGWGSATKMYPADTTSQTNLWSKSGISRKSAYYNSNGQWQATSTSTTVRGSALIPVKPGDKIYCSSFKASSVTGGSQNGVRITFFRSSGNVLKSVAPADVYQEYSKDGYITVPSGAYVMNIPVWTSDPDKEIRNLSLGEERYNPVSKLEFEAVRAKILQKQVQAFADALAANSEEIGLQHKLAIVTFGGGEGTGVSNQGRYENHVSVNGFCGYMYTNTGVFVNGSFINYFSGTSDGVKRASYAPVFAADLDTSEPYYYLEPNDNNNDGTVREVTYNSETGQWVNSDGEVKKPQPNPYTYTSYTQFHSKQMVVPEEITNSQYKNAMVDVLVDGALNTDLQYAINRYVARGTTHTELGMAMADRILAQNKPRTYTDPVTGQQGTSKQIVILFTDGETDDPDKVNGKPTYQTIFYRGNRIKQKGASIFTIGVADEETGSTVDRWMDQLSSNHSTIYLDSNGDPYGHAAAVDIYKSNLALSKGKYYKNIADISQLDEIFEGITSDISSVQTVTSLGANAVMQDFLNNGLKLPSEFNFKDNIKIKIIPMDVDGTETAGGTVRTVNYDESAGNTTSGNVTTGRYKYGSSINLSVSYDKVAGMVSVTGFDYAKYFVGSGNSNRFKLSVQITGVEATEETPTDVLLATNTKQSGIAYIADGKPGLHPFPVPQTQLATRTYVMDYAKPMTISFADWGNVIGIADCSRLKVTTALDTIETQFGTFTKIGESYTFTPSTMQWDQPASFYVLRTLTAEDVPEGVTTGENQWMRVNVVPGNNIYFEDDFDDIVYTGNWSEDGTASNNTENPEGFAGDADGIHGWEGNLNDQQYSDSSAHKGMVNASTKAEAAFTFTGKGVDIYSRTNNTTGTVLVTLRGGTYHEEFGGYYEISKTLIVDNRSESGDYYQIPTVSFMDLPYDTYMVTIRVTTAAADRFSYYLDGVRIYSPLMDDIGYAVAEQGAEVTVIRDLLAAGNKNSAVFIDKAEDGTVGAVKDYNATEYGVYGPKNEIYLAAGQSITFKVDAREDAYYYVGLKCPTGSGNAKAKLSNGAESTLEVGITHATDLYYHVTPDAEGYVTIQNSGTGLLSVTKLRVAGPSEKAVLLKASGDDAVFAVRRFASLPVANSGEDVWSPDTSDVAMVAPVLMVLAVLCLLALVMIPKIRRAGHEA